MKQEGRVKRRCHLAFWYTRFSCNGENRTISQLHKHHLSGKMEACLFLILWSFPCGQPSEPLAQTQWPYQNGLFKSLPKLLKKVITYMNISILDRGQGFFLCKREKTFQAVKTCCCKRKLSSGWLKRQNLSRFPIFQERNFHNLTR